MYRPCWCHHCLFETRPARLWGVHLLGNTRLAPSPRHSHYRSGGLWLHPRLRCLGRSGGGVGGERVELPYLISSLSVVMRT